MGCDIHMYSEKLKRSWSQPTKIKWIPFDFFRYNSYYPERNDDEIWEREFDVDPIYSERNYHLFSLLANVRNYGDRIEPFSEPRGVPDDLSDFVKSEYDKWDGDGHSYSWFSFGELFNLYKGYNWSEEESYSKSSLEEIIETLFSKICKEYYYPKNVMTLDNVHKIYEELLGTNIDIYNEIRIIFWFDN